MDRLLERHIRSARALRHRHKDDFFIVYGPVLSARGVWFGSWCCRAALVFVVLSSIIKRIVGHSEQPSTLISRHALPMTRTEAHCNGNGMLIEGIFLGLRCTFATALAVNKASLSGVIGRMTAISAAVAAMWAVVRSGFSYLRAHASIRGHRPDGRSRHGSEIDRYCRHDDGEGGWNVPPGGSCSEDFEKAHVVSIAESGRQA